MLTEVVTLCCNRAVSIVCRLQDIFYGHLKVNRSSIGLTPVFRVTWKWMMENRPGQDSEEPFPFRVLNNLLCSNVRKGNVLWMDSFPLKLTYTESVMINFIIISSYTEDRTISAIVKHQR